MTLTFVTDKMIHDSTDTSEATQQLRSMLEQEEKIVQLYPRVADLLLHEASSKDEIKKLQKQNIINIYSDYKKCADGRRDKSLFTKGDAYSLNYALIEAFKLIGKRQKVSLSKTKAFLIALPSKKGAIRALINLRKSSIKLGDRNSLYISDVWFRILQKIYQNYQLPDREILFKNFEHRYELCLAHLNNSKPYFQKYQKFHKKYREYSEKMSCFLERQLKEIDSELE